MTIEQLVDSPWLTIIEPDLCNNEQCYLARNPELGGCMAQGATPHEALSALKEARRDLLEVMLASGDTIPATDTWNQMTSGHHIQATFHVDVLSPAPVQEMHVAENVADLRAVYST